MAKILCNSSSVIFVGFIVQKVRELYLAKQSTADIVENQNILVQTTIGKKIKSINNIPDNRERFDWNFKSLQSQVAKNTMTENYILVKINLLEQ